MTQSMKRVDLADGTARVTVRLTEEMRDINDAQGTFYRLLEHLGNNPRLLCCDYNLPQKITITNTGLQWQAEAVAVVRKDLT